MQVEVSSLQERCEMSSTEAAASAHEVEQLRIALGSLETKLLEYQHRDAEVGWGRAHQVCVVLLCIWYTYWTIGVP